MKKSKIMKKGFWKRWIIKRFLMKYFQFLKLQEIFFLPFGDGNQFLKSSITYFNTESNLCCQTLRKVLEKWCYLVHVVKKSVRGKNRLCVRGNTVSVRSVPCSVLCTRLFTFLWLLTLYTLRVIIFLQNRHQ